MAAPDTPIRIGYQGKDYDLAVPASRAALAEATAEHFPQAPTTFIHREREQVNP